MRVNEGTKTLTLIAVPDRFIKKRVILGVCCDGHWGLLEFSTKYKIQKMIEMEFHYSCNHVIVSVGPLILVWVLILDTCNHVIVWVR